MTSPVAPSVLNTIKPTAPAQQPAPAPAVVESPEAKLTAREQAIEKREKAYAAELNKFKDTNRGLGAKLSEYELLKKEVPELRKYRSDAEQRKQLRQLNPVAALEEDFGKDWADKVTNLRVNGVPPVDLVTAAIQRLEQKFEDRLAERDEKTRNESTRAEAGELEEARRIVATESTEWYAANAKDFPMFERLGDPARIGAILGQRREAEFRRTDKSITAQQAAELLEADMLGFVETAIASDKYRSKLHGETKSANVSDASGSVSGDGRTGGTSQSGGTRRTLDNSMTASTSGRAPPRSDEERFQRATEAFNKTRTKG